MTPADLSHPIVVISLAILCVFVWWGRGGE